LIILNKTINKKINFKQILYLINFISKMDDKTKERTYVMIKPDGVVRGLVGEVIRRFENRGLKLQALKMATPSKELVEKHYADLSSKKFFPSLVEYMLMAPVVCMVWSGTASVKTGRGLVGQTDPLESNAGSIRGDFCLEKGRNLIHASDSVESAENEIALWFTNNEIVSYDRPQDKWLFE
jgi:nucleoside-diphosphate kinase